MKRFIDIGANLTDLMYSGLYHGSKKHDPDLIKVLNRSWEAGLQKIIITGGNLKESREALDLANTDDRLYSTVGCHPTRCQEFEENPDDYLSSLEKLIKSEMNKIVAIGECGLDYDRLEFCPKDIQKKYFELQLTLTEHLSLPLFLHCRNASSDLIEIIKKHKNVKGVVHSFDGSLQDILEFTKLGLYIGINGCSLKTNENLLNIKEIPKDRILIETDSPWCEIRPTHAGNSLIKTRFSSVKKEKWNAASMVKGRNEPCNLIQVLEILAATRNEDPAELSEIIYNNTNQLFFNQ